MLELFPDTTWDLIEKYLLFTLSRLLKTSGDVYKVKPLQTKLLKSSRESPELQKMYIAEVIQSFSSVDSQTVHTNQNIMLVPHVPSASIRIVSENDTNAIRVMKRHGK